MYIIIMIQIHYSYFYTLQMFCYIPTIIYICIQIELPMLRSLISRNTFESVNSTVSFIQTLLQYFDKYVCYNG